MIFKKDDIWVMDSNSFSQSFLHKQVFVYLKNNSRIEGIVKGIGLASNTNIGSSDHLPVSINIKGRNINIKDIEKIEIL